MKKLIAIAILGLSGCSHAYIASWDKDEVTACCPSGKILCTRGKLDDLAAEQCGGTASAVGGGTVNTGARANFTSYSVDATTTRDTCVKYQCH